MAIRQCSRDCLRTILVYSITFSMSVEQGSYLSNKSIQIWEGALSEELDIGSVLATRLTLRRFVLATRV